VTVRPRRAQDLPEYRNAVVLNESLCHAVAQLARITGNRNFQYLDAYRHDLAAAKLWWVGTSACDLLFEAYKTMPPATLTREFLPDEYGMVFFERPFTGLDADVDNTGNANVTLDLMTWGVGTVANMPALSMVSWSHLDEERFIGPDPGNHVEIDALPGVTLPLGRSDWPLGHETDQSLPDVESGAAMASVIEDRRLLAALWQLSSQPSITATEDSPPDRATRRRLERRKFAVPNVRIVNLAARHRAVSEGSGGSQSQREYTRRWMVEGHWRQQACGPQWSQHRPTYIAPHIKGPEDKPLVLRDTVKVWR